MNVDDFPKKNPDGSKKFTYRELMDAVKDGTAEGDPEIRRALQDMKAGQESAMEGFEETIRLVMTPPPKINIPRIPPPMTHEQMATLLERERAAARPMNLWLKVGIVAGVVAAAFGIAVFVVMVLPYFPASNAAANGNSDAANSTIATAPALPVAKPTPNIGADVELLINNVGFETSEAKVLSLLGKPLRTAKNGFDECAGGYHRDLAYEGLKLDLLSDPKGRRYSVTGIELTSPKWEISPGIRIGDPFTRVREMFGEPIYPAAEEDGCIFYGIKGGDGFVKFCQADGKLVRVHLNQTLC